VLTSSTLDPLQLRIKINKMLARAGEVAKRMPKLQVLELWSAGKAGAGVFQYRAPTAWNCPRVITWRGNWSLTMGQQVIDTWRSVAAQ
jgi:hypothetical protein